MDLEHQKCLWISTQDVIQKQIKASDDVPWSLSECTAQKLEIVAGVDISFEASDSETARYHNEKAIAALVILRFPSLTLLYEDFESLDLSIPYIPGFLGFRECPAYLTLLNRARAAGFQPQVILVDGCGMLHPRYAGSACQLGVLSGLPTIGVAKTLMAVEGLSEKTVRAAILELRSDPCTGSKTEDRKDDIRAPTHPTSVGPDEIKEKPSVTGILEPVHPCEDCQPSVLPTSIEHLNRAQAGTFQVDYISTSEGKFLCEFASTPMNLLIKKCSGTKPDDAANDGVSSTYPTSLSSEEGEEKSPRSRTSEPRNGCENFEPLVMAAGAESSWLEVHGTSNVDIPTTLKDEISCGPPAPSMSGCSVPAACPSATESRLHIDAASTHHSFNPSALPTQPPHTILPLMGSSGRLLGVAMCTHNSRRPIYVSIGHRLSLETAVSIVLRCCCFRIPEPIRQADLRSRAYLAKSKSVT